MLTSDKSLYLKSHSKKKRNGERHQRNSNLWVRNGNGLANQWSAKKVDPEGGEGKAGQGREEGHGAGEIDIPMEHCSLYTQTNIIEI